VAVLQYKMKALAIQASDKEQLPAIYWKYELIWSILGGGRYFHSHDIQTGIN
jgi:hypothetical protein